MFLGQYFKRTILSFIIIPLSLAWICFRFFIRFHSLCFVFLSVCCFVLWFLMKHQFFIDSLNVARKGQRHREYSFHSLTMNKPRVWILYIALPSSSFFTRFLILSRWRLVGKSFCLSVFCTFFSPSPSMILVKHPQSMVFEYRWQCVTKSIRTGLECQSFSE